MVAYIFQGFVLYSFQIFVMCCCCKKKGATGEPFLCWQHRSATAVSLQHSYYTTEKLISICSLTATELLQNCYMTANYLLKQRCSPVAAKFNYNWTLLGRDSVSSVFVCDTIPELSHLSSEELPLSNRVHRHENPPKLLIILTNIYTFHDGKY